MAGSCRVGFRHWPNRGGAKLRGLAAWRDVIAGPSEWRLASQPGRWLRNRPQFLGRRRQQGLCIAGHRHRMARGGVRQHSARIRHQFGKPPPNRVRPAADPGLWPQTDRPHSPDQHHDRQTQRRIGLVFCPLHRAVALGGRCPQGPGRWPQGPARKPGCGAGGANCRNKIL